MGWDTCGFMLVMKVVTVIYQSLCVRRGCVESIVNLLFLMPFIEEICRVTGDLVGVCYALAPFFKDVYHGPTCGSAQESFELRQMFAFLACLFAAV